MNRIKDAILAVGIAALLWLVSVMVAKLYAEVERNLP